METDDGTRMRVRPQEREAADGHSDRDCELLLAAEAHHRRSVLGRDRPRLEDLAGEWIELLRDSNGKKGSLSQ